MPSGEPPRSAATEPALTLDCLCVRLPATCRETICGVSGADASARGPAAAGRLVMETLSSEVRTQEFRGLVAAAAQLAPRCGTP